MGFHKNRFTDKFARLVEQGRLKGRFMMNEFQHEIYGYNQRATMNATEGGQFKYCRDSIINTYPSVEFMTDEWWRNVNDLNFDGVLYTAYVQGNYIGVELTELGESF